METLFKLSSLIVLPFWALMIFLPRWRVTERLMSTPLVCAAPAALYAALVVPRFAEVWQAVASPELSGVAALLGSPVGATIAWLHFLAFDLFVGRWIYLDSRERGVNGWFMAPVLFLTLMLGPCGFLLYLMVCRTRGYLQASENVIPVSTGSKERG
jgi:apolipoprotein N-acyltransferase